MVSKTTSIAITDQIRVVVTAVYDEDNNEEGNVYPYN
jgi:hypothetical protein